MKIVMRQVSLLGISLLALSGCDRLATIPFSPEQTPESWLQIQPFVDLKIGTVDFILVQPSSTIFVYLLGIITIGIGLYFFQIQGSSQSGKWWGIALLLWGLGALFAGTSYQAFSFEIKCAGQALCSWTSWWEIIYLLLSAASIDAMLISGAYSSCRSKYRNVLKAYAILNIVLYSVLVIIGAFMLNEFLISFELLLIVTAPNIVILFFLSGWRYFKYRNSMDFALLVTWIWLGVTIGVYFLYLELDFTEDLWERGIWFSENDVLHIGLICWMIYIAINVSKRVTDAPNLDVISSRSEGY
jgi:hypothetical protein